MRIPSEVHVAIDTLLTELLTGPPGNEAYMLNGGDRGLLGALESVPAAYASQRGQSGSSIAAHVDHLRYGFSLMNRWVGGEPNPFANSDWAAAWKNMSVTESEWNARRHALRDETSRWRQSVATRQEVNQLELNGIIASVAHLAYHLGAIRQILPSTRGPLA